MKKITFLLLLMISLTIPGVSFAEPAEEEPIVIEEPMQIPPAAPAEVYVSGIEDTQATVSWSPVSGATQYTVWVNGQRWAGGPSLSAEIRLQPYTEYSVYVTAVNADGESSPSPAVQFKTLPPVPAAPERPEISETTGSSAVVKWQPLPAWQYIQKYRIYVDGQPMADVDPREGIQVVELKNLSGGNHTVSVSGINENREGDISPAVIFTVQTAAAPTGLMMSNRTDESIWIIWDTVSGADIYRIYVDGLPVGSTKENRFLLEHMDANTEYQIGVSAVMPDGNESVQTNIQVETLPVSESINLESLKGIAAEYTPDIMPEIIAIFVVGAAFAIARMGKFVFSRRLIFRY